MLKILVFVLSAVLAWPALAWNKTLTVEYVLGDGDSRISAKAHAQEAIRMKASEQAKTYIQTSTTLSDDGELSETIEVVGASMVEITNYNQEFHLNNDGRQILTATALVKVDESVLHERIQAIQADSEKQAKIRQLALENYRLRSRLLDHLGDNDVDNYGSLVSGLAAEQELLAELRENRSSVNAVFMRGTLLQLASESELELEAAKRSVEQRVLSKLMNTEVETSIHSVVPSGNGYDAQVVVSWEAEMLSFKNELEKWFSVDQGYRNGPLSVRQPDPRFKGFRTRQHLFEWLAKKQIVLHVAIEGVSAKIPLLYAAGGHILTRCNARTYGVGYKPREIKLCISTPPVRTGQSYHGTALTNPLTLHLSEAQASRATSVEAVVRLETLK